MQKDCWQCIREWGECPNEDCDPTTVASDKNVGSKYKWHDLRKAPTDVPTNDGYYLCRVESDNFFPYRVMMYKPCNGIMKGYNKWLDEECYVYDEFVIAWKEIEEVEE